MGDRAETGRTRPDARAGVGDRGRPLRTRGLLSTAWNVFAAAATAVVLSAALIACGGGNHSNAFQSPAPTGSATHDSVLLQGREVYEVHCAQCHGVSGAGGTGPSFTDGKLLRDFPTVAAQLLFVHKRRIGSALTASQLGAVVRYEREVLSARK